MTSPVLEHHWTDCGLQTADMNSTHYFVSEKDGLNGLRHTEYKIQTFLKESLIPLARQHNALVIVSDSSCSLSQVFGKLCAAEAERRRGNLGFYVLAFLRAPYLLLSCKNPDTIAFQLRRASKNWRKYEDKMWYVLKKAQGDESMFYSHYADAPDGCTHYIVVDCISEDESGLKRDWGPVTVLRARLVQAVLSSQIPGFGVATMQYKWGYRWVGTFADLVARGIPVLLLDSRDPPLRPVQSVQEAIAHLSQLNDDLAQEGTGHFYYTSALAFLHQALLSLLQRSHARRTFGDGAGGQVVEDRITKDSRVPLWQQVETLKEETFVNDGSMESMEDTTCILRQQDARHSLAESLVEGFLTMMGNKTTSTHKKDFSELPKDHFKNILLRTVGELLRCNSRANLDEFLEHYSLRRLSTEHLKRIASFKNAPFCVKHGMKAGTLFKRILQVAPEADWKDAKQYIFSCLKEECLQFDGKFQLRSHLPHSPDIKGAFVEVLVSPLTHSANLVDLTRIEKVLMLVNVDQRVHGVDLTSCQVLQRAWADVDVYHHVASQMKWVAKISYAIVLLTGYAITVLTIVNVNVPDAMPEEITNYIVLGLSVSVGVTSALMAYIDPTTKWQQLRAAACADIGSWNLEISILWYDVELCGISRRNPKPFCQRDRRFCIEIGWGIWKFLSCHLQFQSSANFCQNLQAWAIPRGSLEWSCAIKWCWDCGWPPFSADSSGVYGSSLWIPCWILPTAFAKICQEAHSAPNCFSVCFRAADNLGVFWGVTLVCVMHSWGGCGNCMDRV